MSPRRTAALLLAAGLLLASCRDRSPSLALDGSPRHPDDEGVVTSVSVKSVTLDGKRTFPLSPRLASFSTYSLVLMPVLNDAGRYVQLGLEDKTVVWIAAVGPVVTGATPRVIYTGQLLRVERGSAVFEDGTVLRLGRGVTAPSLPRYVRADIDPAAHEVVALVPT